MDMPPPPTGPPTSTWPPPTFREPAPRSERATRLIAAAAHLGVPSFSVITPLIVWSLSSPGTLPRRHARQAFSYQCLYLPIHIALTALMLFGPFMPLLLCLTAGFALELPQIALAMAGRPPLRLLPTVLKE
jgi:hypothetical protein